MNKLLVPFVALCAAVTVAGAQQKFGSDLQSASIYLSGATLVHTSAVALQAGSAEVIIEGLSPNIDIGSLVVSADRGVLISSSEFFKSEMKDPAVALELSQAKDSLAQAKELMKGIQNGIDVENKLLALLAEGVENNLKSKVATASDINGNLEIYRKNSASIYASLDKKTSDLDKARRAAEELEKRVAELVSKQSRRCGAVRLAVTAPSSGKTTFTIKYFTPNAGWEPVYDINVASANAPVALKTKAQVFQRTGLDWKGVKLSLSSGRPNSTNIAPVFSTWYINFAREPLYAAKAARNTILYSSPVVADVAMADGMSLEEEDSFEYEALSMDDYVLVADSDVNVNYVIDLPYDISGDGSRSTIELSNNEVPAEYYYYSAPKLSEDVFLMAGVSDWGRFALLPGEANVSYSGTFVGKTYINPNTTEKILELTLGTEPRISVKRELSDNLKTTSNVGASTVVSRGYNIVVNNAMQKEVRLVLKEQYPLSSDKDIEVKLTEIAPDASYNKKETGVVTWETTLPAAAQSSFTVSYNIKYPKNKTLNL